jgi:hypothetical protein
MADESINALATQNTPWTYLVPQSVEFVLKSAQASFDGSGTGSGYVPALQVTPPGGIAHVYTLGQTVAAGASADVTWFPGVKAAPAAAGWQFGVDPQSGTWGVVSVTADDPTPYAGPGPYTTYAFRLDCVDANSSHGMLLVCNGDAISTHYSYLNLAAGRATLDGQDGVQINTFNPGHQTNIGSNILQLPNIPTSNAGLTAGEVYRNGAGADVALMVK